MNPDARDLFTRAFALDPEARKAFLAEACGDDAELRLEVQRMLVDSEKADAYFSDADGVTLGAAAFDATYAESGTVEELMEKYGLTAWHVVAAAREALADKSCI